MPFSQSVHIETMSQKVRLHVLLLSVFLFCATMILNVGYVSSLPESYLELLKLDISEIESYLSKLDLTDVPTTKMMVAGFKCSISALPFGALKSDWSRLLLLQEAQPQDSIIKRKLDRIIRILIIAYYEMEERFDVTMSDAQISAGTATAELPADNMNKTHISNGDYSSTIASADNTFHQSHTYLSMTRTTNDDYSREKSSTTEVEFTTESSPGFNATIGVVSLDTGYRSTTSSTNSNSTESYRIDAAYRRSTENPVFRLFGNCLGQSMKNIARRYSSHTDNNIFEKFKNGATYSERSTRWRKNINGYERNRTISKLPLTRNEFWKYMVFPTKESLTISTVARPYRMQGLNGIEMNPRKSRERASLATDIYQSFR